MKVALGVFVALLLLVVLAFGTISPCGILRTKIRNEAQHEGGLGTVIAALPDSVIDGILAAQFGALTPGRCIALVLNGPPVQAPPPQTKPPQQTQIPYARPEIEPQNRFVPPDAATAAHEAQVESLAAIKTCRDARLAGAIPSFTASAACSNPRIIEAYRKAKYRYMDLVIRWTSERTDVSQRIDSGQLTEAQGQQEMSQFMNELTAEQRARDLGQR